MMSGKKVVPAPDDLDLEFFRAILSSGEMCLQQCRSCGSYAHPPRYYCRACFSPDYAFVAVSGLATVYSHTLSHYTTEPAWADEVPFATIVAELDEGPRVVCAAHISDLGWIRIGAPIRVVAEPRTDDFAFLTAHRRLGA
jgi:uncharacterized OB-fold protein